MADPVTVGALVAGALAAGAAELAKGVLGEAAKDAYARLKSCVGRWSSSDVEALEAQAREAKPTTSREGVLAESIDARPVQEQAEAKAFAAALVETLKQQAVAGGPVGIDIGRLDALAVDLGRVAVTEGTGFRAKEVKTGTFRTDGIEVGSKTPGKS